MKRSSETRNHGFFNSDSDQTPHYFLHTKSTAWNLKLSTKEFAIRMDNEDPLAHMRQNFFYPKKIQLPNVDKKLIDSNEDCIYLCGQSLGLMPVQTTGYIYNFLNDWATLGVYGHFMGSNPWAKCDATCVPMMSLLVGGHMKEIAVMNQLSSNLHFMMTAFYQPTNDRYKILCEENAFPSDQYAIDSQIRLHGYDPQNSKIIVKPRKGEHCLRTEDILDTIRREGHSVALVIFGGIHYYTGQLFDIKTITQTAHEQGCCVGWDLAHAVGNVPLQLHDWQVDFAVWCTYKYLNSGAGCIGGVFVHENHFGNNSLTTLDGWWGNRESSRFSMFESIDRDLTANGFRVSNPSIHQCATLLGSLENFSEVGIHQLRAKSVVLTEYLQYLLKHELQDTEICPFTQLTPYKARERGAQLSIRPHVFTAQQISDELERFGVVIDIRGDVIRVAPAPMYNSFIDVFNFVSLFKQVVIELRVEYNQKL